MKIMRVLAILLLMIPAVITQAQNLRDTVYLDPVTIQENITSKIPYIRDEIRKDEIEKLAVRDAGDLLRSIPNVSGIRKGGVNIDPVVRGFKFSQIGVIINGGLNIEGGCPNRMDPTASHVISEDIAAIEVYKGPYSLRYGPNFGGVINFITEKPQPFTKAGVSIRAVKGYESNWNGHKEHISIKGGGSKVYFLLSGNHMNYGNYRDGNGNQLNSSFRHYSYNARLGASPWKNHGLILSFSRQYGRNVRFPALPMDEREDNTSIYSLDYSVIEMGKTLKSLSLKAYAADVEHIMDNKQRSNSDTMSAVAAVDAITAGGRLEFQLEFGGKHQLFLGISHLLISKDGERVRQMIMQPPANGIIPYRSEKLWNEARIENTGFFAEYKSGFGQWDVLASVRIDRNKAESGKIELFSNATPPVQLLSKDETGSEYFNFSAAAGVVRRFGENFSAGLSAGRGVRSPNMLERFIILLPVGYDNYEYLGNPSLKPETNNEIDLTVRYKKETIGGFELNVFYSIVEDFISGRRLPASQQKPLTMNVLGVKEFYNAGTATFKGFEFSYTTPMTWKTGIGFTSAYTYATLASATKQILDMTKIPTQRVIDEVEVKNDAVPEVPPLEAEIKVRHTFFAGRLIPEIAFRYVMPQKHVSEAFYEEKTPDFGLLSLRASYNHNQYLSIHGGVHNLLDKAYYEHLNRRIIGSAGRLYEPGRSFFISMIVNL